MYLFQSLNKIQFENIKRICDASEKEFKKDDIIFSENDECSSIGIVLSGLIICQNYFSNTKNDLIRMFSKYMTFGEALVFSDNPKYLGTFKALKDSKILFIEKDKLLNALQDDKEFLSIYLNHLSKQYIEINNHTKVLLKKNVRSKLLSYLYFEYQKTNNTTFEINFSITELSLYLNTKRPTLSKELHKIIDEGLISVDKKTYTIINIDSLKKCIE